jgi:alpha-beta hydrolase superfamily lysophospholipase
LKIVSELFFNFIPVEDRLVQKEFHRKGFDNAELFYQLWESPEPAGTLIITHGQGEHSDAYVRLAEGIQESKFDVYGWDLRGHGRSSGKRGYAAYFEEYCYDYEMILKAITAEMRKKPLVLLGHSMGGLILIKTLLDNISIDINGVILSSPLLGLNHQVPIYKEKGAHLLNLLTPEVTLSNELKYEDLSRDPAVVEEYQRDVLRHDRISPGVFLGFSKAMPITLSRASKFKYPLLLQVAMADKVCNPQMSLEFFEQCGSPEKKLIKYEGASHEVYNDIEIVRQQAYKDVIQFLKETVDKNA